MSLKVYEYKSCSTCQKALKFLDQRGVDYVRIPIVEQPPSISELKKMLSHLKAEGGSFKQLFNTSGVLYREMRISEKLKDGMSEDDSLELLSKHGKLIRRPFALSDKLGFVGFKAEEWRKFQS